MSECVREMTDNERAKFIMEILERGGYNMKQWERDFLKAILQEKINILPYTRKQGYQPTIERISNPPNTGSSVQSQEELCDTCTNKGKRCYLNEKVAYRGYERIYVNEQKHITPTNSKEIEKAILDLQEYIGSGEYNGSNPPIYINTIDEAIFALKKQLNNWIPVSETLPTSDGRFEVTIKGKGNRHVGICNFYRSANEGRGKWGDSWDGLNVIAWKERSKPYNK